MYLQTWGKYLPVIRILLKRAAAGVQTVDLNKTDFETGGSRTRKLACSFSIQLVKGRLAVLTQSVTAKTLLEVLQEDDVAYRLMQEHTYEISLNNAFRLSITNITAAAEAESSNAAEPEDAAAETAVASA